MNIHEYQAQDLLRRQGIKVLDGEIAASVEEAVAAYRRLDSKQVVIKAQVHAGGRGQAGGIRIVENKQGLTDTVKNLLGTRLITHQTDEKGQPIDSVYIVKPCKIQREMYLSATIDRQCQAVTFIAARDGGVDIEESLQTSPEKICTFTIEPLAGVVTYQCLNAANVLGLEAGQRKAFTQLIKKLYDMLIHYDLTLLEINPLVIDDLGELVCLDTKINVDDNALYRQALLRQMRDIRQEDERESRAKKWELSYIALDGNIGCMVNGAGLAMATMDLVLHAGGRPANFLDVGGGVTKERVSEAFKIILSDQNVAVVLINIFGGIVRCDLIAEGIIMALAEVNTNLPVVIRLEGNHAEKGNKRLSNCGLNIITAHSLEDAARKTVGALEEN